MQSSQSGINREVISVSELNRGARRLLEGNFSMVWVEGEISNFVRPSSGHWYFTLKDQSAQLRCAMFRNRNQLLRFTPKDGVKVIIRGRVSLYEGRGDYQLIADHIEEAGEGALRVAFEQLKIKLQLEGLFDERFKQTLPELPTHIGIITSPTGAAIHDVLNVLKRRFPAIRVSILPVQVQGNDAKRQISEALTFANQYDTNPFDVLLVTRGGGSLEDLWSFNTEGVARAIADSAIPVVSAVGHESDVSIADFVADLRAPTPSAAAELISPDMQDWLATIRGIEQRLATQFTAVLSQQTNNLQHLSQRLRHPGQRVQDLSQQLDNLELRLHNNWKHRLASLQGQLDVSTKSLVNPRSRLQEASLKTVHLREQLVGTMNQTLRNRDNQLHTLTQKLNALSPLATLERGFAIASSDAAPEKVITNATDVSEGELINVRLQYGSLTAEVKALQK
jgi:exodeoxyribonuclease VII large subunit